VPDRPAQDGGLLPFVADLPLFDHHCHGVIRRDLDRRGFEALLTEAGDAYSRDRAAQAGVLHDAERDNGSPGRSRRGPGETAPGGVTLFDSQIGLAVRRWCPPVLGLAAQAPPDEYLARRAELGHAEVSRRFLRASGLEGVLVDTGFEPEPLLSPPEMGKLAGVEAREIVRLEQVAESVAAGGASAAGFAGAFRDALAARGRGAAGVKSVAAYRVGLDLAGERPAETEVAAAAAQWLGAQGNGRTAPRRLADPVLHRFLIWCGVDLGLPVQFHVGYGDRDVDLDRCNPLLLTGLLRAIEPAGTPVMLLHNYPYHREAGYLAQVFPNVYVDVGLATHNVGHRAPALIAETLELAPFGKFLYSSDAFGLPELYHLGAVLFRRGLSGFLRTGLDDGAWTLDDAERVAQQAAYGNARRAYRLPAS
jgi:predicted TIM-barrel fold metal-dependent hydrolase